MSVNFNNNISQYQYPQQKRTANENNFGGMSPQTQAELQKAGAVVKDTAKNSAKDSLIGSLLSGLGVDTSNPKKAIISAIGAIAVVFGTSGLINHSLKTGSFFKATQKLDDFFANSKTAGKIADFTKDISENNGVIKGIKNFLKENSITKFFKDKSNILKPKNGFAKPMLRGTKGEVLDTVTDTLRSMMKDEDLYSDLEKFTNKSTNIDDAKTLLKNLKKNKIFSQKEKQLIGGVFSTFEEGKGLSDEGIKALKSIMEGHSEKGSVLTDTLKKLTKKEDVSDLKKLIKEFSENDEMKFENFEKIYEQMTKEFRNPKTGKIKDINKFLEFLGQEGEIGKIIQKTDGGFMTGQTVNLAEAIKKYALLNGDTASTKLTQRLQQITLRGIEAISNGVASRTFMGFAMGLFIYNGVMNKSQDAPKGEGTSTFAHEAIGDMGNYMMLPVAGTLLYNAASLSKFGISKASKDALKLAGEDIAKATTKEGAKTAKVAYKEILKSARKEGNIFQKLTRLITKPLAIGLESNPLKGAFKNKLRGFGGGALRLIAVMFAISPFLMKPIMKACHTVFGTPTEVKKEEEEKAAKKNGKDKTAQPQEQTPATNSNTTNYLDKYNNTKQENKQVEQKPATQQPVAQQPLQQNESIDAKKIKDEGQGQKKQARSYVPSAEPTQFQQTEDYSSINDIMSKADRVEKNAMQYL